MGYEQGSCSCYLCSRNVDDGGWVCCERCHDDLRGQLDAANERIAELETELEDAQNASD